MNKKWKKLVFNSCHEIKILVDFSWPSLLTISDIGENVFIDPPAMYTRPEIPVLKEDIST